MKFYSQRDSSYCQNTLGDSTYTIKRFGCTVTSICNLIKLKLKKDFSPKEGAKLWKFTNTGLLFWGSVKYGSLEHRSRSFGRPSHSKATEYINSSNKGVIFEVNNGTHWILPIQWGWRYWPYFLAVDPNTLKNGKAIIRKFPKSQITGFSSFNLK